MASHTDVDQKRISVLFEQKTVCDNCNGEAYITISEYLAPYERLIIITLKCSECGYKKTDIVPIIDEDSSRCLEIRIEDPVDLNTLVYIPPGSTIEIPEVNLKVDLAELSHIDIGSYTTIDGILLDMLENLEQLCPEQGDLGGIERCRYTVESLRRAIDSGGGSLTIRIVNSYGNVKVVKSYRSNSRSC